MRMAHSLTYGCCLPYPGPHEGLAVPLGFNQDVSHHGHHHLELLVVKEALGQTKFLHHERPAVQPASQHYAPTASAAAGAEGVSVASSHQILEFCCASSCHTL